MPPSAAVHGENLACALSRNDPSSLRLWKNLNTVTPCWLIVKAKHVFEAFAHMPSFPTVTCAFLSYSRLLNRSRWLNTCALVESPTTQNSFGATGAKQFSNFGEQEQVGPLALARSRSTPLVDRSLELDR